MGASLTLIIWLWYRALRKTSHILLSLSRLVSARSARPPITYYALDLEEREIERTLREVAASKIGELLQGRVETKGMCGTYNAGLKFVKEGGLNMGSIGITPTAFSHPGIGDISPLSSDSSATSAMDSDGSPPSTPDEVQPPLHILFLGSSLGNFTREGATDFLRSLPLRPGSNDTLLLGLDHDNDQDIIEKAYNDPSGYTERFIMNGLRAAGRALGNENIFDEDKWEYVNLYNVVRHPFCNKELLLITSIGRTYALFICWIYFTSSIILGQHEAYYESKCAQTIQDPSTKKEISFLKAETIKIEESLKVGLFKYTYFHQLNSTCC